MQIHIHDWKDANFPVKVQIFILLLCIIQVPIWPVCYTPYKKLKDSQALKNVPKLSVRSLPAHDLYPIGFVCCRTMIGNLQFMYMFIVCTQLQKELIFKLYMQQLHQLGCDWVDNGCMFLPQGANALINSIDIMNVTHLRAISNIEIPACSIVTIPTWKTGKCTTNAVCIFEVVISEEYMFRTSSYVTNCTFKRQIPMTLINLSHDMIQVAKHVLTGCLKLYAVYQEKQNPKIHQLGVEQPCILPSTTFVCCPAEVSTHRGINIDPLLKVQKLSKL